MGSLKWKKTMLWLKRFGLIGFVLFLIKGLIWLAIFLGLAKLFNN